MPSVDILAGMNNELCSKRVQQWSGRLQAAVRSRGGKIADIAVHYLLSTVKIRQEKRIVNSGR